MTAGTAGNSGTDADDDSRPIVYDLAPDCTADDIEIGDYYHAVVNGVVAYGVFVDISDTVSGLVHESNLTGEYDVGDHLLVRLDEIRENDDVAFAEADLDDYRTVAVDHQPTVTPIEALEVGETATIEAMVSQIKQTAGPTVFRCCDASGIVACTAFEDAGVRAHPEVELDDAVRISGTVEEHEGSPQIEVESLTRLQDESAARVREQVDAGLTERAEPHDVDPLVEWDAFEKLRDDLRAVAQQLRRTVLEGRPIRVRHHADGDGMCASLPVQVALERFIRTVHDDDDAPRHLIKRLPSKAPYYEMEDVTRDLNFALEGRERHGQKLPLLLMLDNGSTEEDVPAYKNLAHYDVPIVVVDHHHPDPEAVEPLVETHVNPYLHDEDYRITTGMMCVELARMIDPDVTEDLRHVPAVAGLSDRSEGEAMPDYLDLAADAGYDEARLREIGEALDYATHWLRYNDGRELINDVLNVNCDDRERHAELVDLLAERAERDVADQLDAAMAHVTEDALDNGARLYRLDVERHAKRFTYPAPGKTTGEVHDRKVEETGDPVITIGMGPDFAVLRSDGVRLDIPQMVADLQEEYPGAGVSGGGHLVVGSIKYVPGRQAEVLDALVEKMAEAEIDEELGSSEAAIPDEP